MVNTNFQIQIKNLVSDAAFRSNLYNALRGDFGEHFTISFATETWMDIFKICHNHGSVKIKEKVDIILQKYIGDINFFVFRQNKYFR